MNDDFSGSDFIDDSLINNENLFDEDLNNNNIGENVEIDDSAFNNIVQNDANEIFPDINKLDGNSFGDNEENQIFADNYLSETEIHEMVEQMRGEFDLGELEVHEWPGFENAAQDPGNNNIMSYDDNIYYDSDFIVEMSKKYGEDVATGIIGHEIGHTLVRMGTLPHDHEFTADLVSGMLSARRGCTPEAMTKFYLSPEVRAESESHPHGFFRLAKFKEGFELAQNNPELSLSDILEQTSIADNISETNLVFDSFYREVNEKWGVNETTNGEHSVSGEETHSSIKNKTPDGISFGVAGKCSRCYGTGVIWNFSEGKNEACYVCGGSGIGPE